MRRLCATVLIFEAIVIGLAIPVAITIGHVSPREAGPAGGALAGAAVLTSVAVSLRALGAPGLRLALIAGCVLQLLMIASGAIVPVMYALGVIFAVLWTVAIFLGRSAERTAPRQPPLRAFWLPLAAVTRAVCAGEIVAAAAALAVAAAIFITGRPRSRAR